eukprot:TRINITY_DN3089_c0_g1_i1.p1 TRINITY_DN3089_c0_g1~~TRINITY_DN3089_c0_g1_i1.p1  ORF type:complete len:955 (+),score=133.44 TRINITY_DN3089_c0_g1_i1:106-2970(+)
MHANGCVGGTATPLLCERSTEGSIDGCSDLPNYSGGKIVGQTSVELAALVRPPLAGSCCGSSDKVVAAHDIWQKVVNDNARLPGCWDATVAGALDAAEKADWALCAYLAACCFADGGGADGRGASALATPDSRSHDHIWLDAVCPIVVDVPRGRERLCVQVEDGRPPQWVPTDELTGALSSTGTVGVRGRGKCKLARGTQGSAEQFKVGTVMQPMRFKRLVLRDDELLQLRQFSGGDFGWEADQAIKPSFLDRNYPLAHIPGVWFHVLAYPLAGDVTKALLRPALGAWKSTQRSALLGLGETLVSRCAKAGQWNLVETLLEAGVPCPDLLQEFGSVCGSVEAVQSQWKREVTAALASRSASGRPPSLVELAAWDTEYRPSPLSRILAALKANGQRVSLGGGSGRVPLIVAAAEAGRWDVVTQLLEEPEEEIVFAASLLKSPSVAGAPASVVQMAEDRAQEEESKRARARTLREYFSRLLAGEVVTGSMAPSTYSLKSGVLRHASRGIQVLNAALYLGDGSAAGASNELAFVSVSGSELTKAAEMISDAAATILPLDLSGRYVTQKEKELSEALGDQTSWLAISCPRSYMSKAENSLTIPANSIPSPYVQQRTPVRVRVVTPCCGDALPGVPIYIDDKWAGVTGSDGTVEVRLLTGSFTLTAPRHSYAQETIRVDGPWQNDLSVCLETSGELFLFLQDMTVDDAVKDGVMLCSNRSSIPEDSSRFIGSATLPGCMGQMLRVRSGSRCSDVLKKIKVCPADGRAFKPIEDLTWFDDFENECQLSMLSSGTPLRLGDLLGAQAQPQAHFAATTQNVPLSCGASKSSGSRPSTASLSRQTSSLLSRPPSAASAVSALSKTYSTRLPPSLAGSDRRRMRDSCCGASDSRSSFDATPRKAAPSVRGTAERRPHMSCGAQMACRAPVRSASGNALRPRSASSGVRWRQSHPLSLSDHARCF